MTWAFTAAKRGALLVTTSAVLLTGIGVSSASAEDFVPAPQPTAQTATDTVPGLPPLPPATAGEPLAPPPPADGAGSASVTTSSSMAEAITIRLRTDPQFRLSFVALIKERVATDAAFAASFRALVAERYASDPFFRVVWAAGVRAEHNANIDVGPTTWTGGPLTHPRGIAYPSSVTRWGELLLGVMAELNIDPYYFPGILAQIQQESSGNPGAVNGWDSNARAGYASMGLLQVIAPTYQAHAKPGLGGTITWVSVPGTSIKQQFASPWQTHPYANLYAALSYVIKRYGYSKFAAWNGGANQGY